MKTLAYTTSLTLSLILAIIGAASSANAAIVPLVGGAGSFASPTAVDYPVTPLSGFDASGASKIVFTLSDEDGFGDGDVSGVTFGDDAMDLAVSANNSNLQQARVYYLDASSVDGGSFGVGDLVINGEGSNDLGGSWLFLSGTVDGVGPTNSSLTQSVNLTTLVDNSFVVAAHANNGNSGTAQSPLTPLLDGDVGSAGGGSGYATIATAGAGDYSFTGSTARPITVAAAFEPTDGSGGPFAITEIEYDAVAQPDPTVTLTWRKTGAAIYIAWLSYDMSDWGEDLDDSISPEDDERPEDTEHITMSFLLKGDRADAADLFFRIEEG
jgi:hypothetical protein